MLTLKLLKDGVEKISIDFDDVAELALAHVVEDPIDWLLPLVQGNSKGNDGFRGGAIMQKIVKCKKEMIKDGLPILQADQNINNASIPTDEGALITMISQHPAYMNRKQRDAEEAKVQLLTGGN